MCKWFSCKNGQRYWLKEAFFFGSVRQIMRKRDTEWEGEENKTDSRLTEVHLGRTNLNLSLVSLIWGQSCSINNRWQTGSSGHSTGVEEAGRSRSCVCVCVLTTEHLLWIRELWAKEGKSKVNILLPKFDILDYGCTDRHSDMTAI